MATVTGFGRKILNCQGAVRGIDRGDEAGDVAKGSGDNFFGGKFGSVFVLIAFGAKLIPGMNVVELCGGCVLPFYGIRGVALEGGFRSGADRHGLVVDGERNGARLAVHLLDEAADAAALPVQHFLLLVLRDVLLLHDDDGRGIERGAIAGGFSAHQDAVANL